MITDRCPECKIPLHTSRAKVLCDDCDDYATGMVRRCRYADEPPMLASDMRYLLAHPERDARKHAA